MMPDSIQSENFPSVDSLREALRRVIDPEVGMNIVDLGLIYAIDIVHEPQRSFVKVTMTMTSPACPMGEMIVEDVESVLHESLPENVQIEVSLVWEPPWNPKLMSEEARRHYGW